MAGNRKKSPNPDCTTWVIYEDLVFDGKVERAYWMDKRSYNSFRFTTKIDYAEKFTDWMEAMKWQNRLIKDMGDERNIKVGDVLAMKVHETYKGTC